MGKQHRIAVLHRRRASVDAVLKRRALSDFDVPAATAPRVSVAVAFATGVVRHLVLADLLRFRRSGSGVVMRCESEAQKERQICVEFNV